MVIDVKDKGGFYLVDIKIKSILNFFEVASLYI